MRVHIAGADANILTQIPRLREGFAALGHEHVSDPLHPDVAFVFVGNPDFTPYLHLRGQKKLIFNVLDLPFHVPEVNDIIARLRQQLPLADRTTTISKTVAAQLKEHCDISAEVIYYPMKPVCHTGMRKYPQFRVMACGRVADGNKYFSSAIMALIRAGFNESEIAVVGPEPAPWGTRLGVVSDQVLNDLYNSVDYVIMLDKWAGLGLPAIEAACCGAIPIVASHLSTLQEFWVDSPLGLHYQTLNSVESVAALITSIEKDADWKAQLKRDFLAHANTYFRPKFEATAVAQRILDTYLTIP